MFTQTKPKLPECLTTVYAWRVTPLGGEETAGRTHGKKYENKYPSKWN